MSPTIPRLGAGPAGYADWNRTTDADGPLLLNDGSQHVGPVVDPPVLVTRWSYLALRASCAPAVLITLQWYADQACTILTGERVFTWGDPGNPFCQMRLPNLGPWLQVTWDPFGAGISWQRIATYYGTNRYSPVEQISRLSTVADFGPTAIPINTDVNIYIGDGAAGPALMAYKASAAGGLLGLHYQKTPGGWSTFWEDDSVAAGAYQVRQVALPLGSWRVAVFGGPSGFNLNLKIVASGTGST